MLYFIHIKNTKKPLLFHEVDVTSIPVAKRKKSIRETHKTKAFYIRNDIAKQIDKDIRNSRRGAMTEIVNALFEEYYKSQGRL